MTTWRRILRQQSDSYLAWLDETRFEYKSLDHLATQLSEYLVSCIRTEADARKFWEVIPKVRSACNDPDTYKLPWAAEAYAYVHLLYRYCRTWAVLRHLTSETTLPLGNRGVRVLDIGSGPASALYAIDDYYSALAIFANESKIPELDIEHPMLDCVENSPAMARFMHYFSEYCQRKGPFSPTIIDFTGLDFRSIRESHFRNSRYETYWDECTETYEELYDPSLVAEENNRLFRYRLVILSNSLTLSDTVSRFETELRSLFNDLRPGSVVVVLGGTGDDYQKIYARLAQFACDAKMIRDEWDTDTLGDQIDDCFSTRIKVAQHTVYEHLVTLANSPPLPQTNQWPDYWEPEPSPKARSKFALRVFRRGFWPKNAPVNKQTEKR